MTGTCRQRISIELYADKEAVETIGEDILSDYFSDSRYDAEYSIDEDHLSISITETGRFESEPMVLYTRNGDGYPGHYEDDLTPEDDIVWMLREYSNAHPEYEIEIEGHSVTYIDAA